MNKKTFLFMFLALSLALIFSGATAASNNSTNLTVTPNNNTITDFNSSTTTQQTNTSNNTKLPDPTNTRTGDHFSTIQAAIDASDTQNGDTILVEAGTYLINTPITVDKSLTIIGTDQSNTIINAQGLCSIFNIPTGVIVTLEYLTLQNGYTFSNGIAYYSGAITNDGTLTVNNCTFNHNIATGPYGGVGGAIYNEESSTLNVNNSTFTNNNASSTSNYGSDGGAIANTGTSTITSSTFTDNTANNGEGGAIYNYGFLTITNNIFTDNNATYGGGAIANEESSTLNVDYSTFTNNTGTYGVGAIYNGESSTLNVNNSTFTNNTGYSGGAIENDGNLTVDNCTFTNNTGYPDGGAIYNEYNCTLTVNNSTFTGNTVTGAYGSEGGAIYNNGGTLTVNNSSFTNNTATGNLDTGQPGSGGAIGNSGTLTVDNSTFTGNNATAPYGGSSGGAICNTNKLTVGDCIFTDNSASYGGAIYNIGTLNDTNSTFTQNTAEQGGAMYDMELGTVNDTNNTYNSNIASSGGAIYNYQNGFLNETSNTFTQNNAPTGGVIYNNGIANVNFNRIVGNTETNGNLIYNDVYGSMNAMLNWWGTNNGPTGNYIVNNGDYCYYNPWIILSINANPTSTLPGATSTITADLLHDNLGVYHDPANGVVPYTGLVNFATSQGTINNANMLNGVAISILNVGTVLGVDIVSATVDYTTINTQVIVNYVTTSIIDNTLNGKTNPGNLVTFTITLYNNAPEDATNVILKEILPLGLQYWSSPNSDVSYNHATRTITWTGIGTLPANEINAIRTFIAQVNSNVAGTTVTTNATETNSKYPGISTTNDSIYVNNSPVTVTVTDNTNNGQANVNDLVTYTVTLHNNGPDPAQNVYLKVMPLNLGLTYVSSNGGVYNSATRAIVWNNLGTIASGANLVETFTVKPGTSSAGKNILINVFQKNDAQSGGVYGTNTIHVKKSVLAMTMTNTATNGQAQVGDLVTYTITLKNNGPDSADNVAVQELPMNYALKYISSSDNGVYNSTTHTINWNIGSITNGGQVILTFTVQVSSIAKGTIKNAASATQNGYSSNPKNSSTITII
jgi:uncharacterized repeat protein (TIGR01451 family)